MNKMINMFDEIKYFIQRGQRGYSDRDLWSFDCYLASVIIKGLKQFKQTNHGIPCDIHDKFPNDDEAKKKWEFIIDKMIDGFDCAILLVNEPGLDHDEKKEAENIRNEGFDLFKEYFGDLWD